MPLAMAAIVGGTAVVLAPTILAAPPIAVDDQRTVPVDVPITINVLNNDSDPDGDGIRVTQVTDAANGTVTLNPDGGILYRPNPGFTGQDRFGYTVTDDSEAAEQATAFVDVNVVPSTMPYAQLNPNNTSVAQAIDQVCAALGDSDLADLPLGSQELADRCQGLLALAAVDPEAAAEAIEQIAPEETLSLSRVGTNATEFQTETVANRMAQLGQGLQAATDPGFSWSWRPQGGAAGDGSIQARWGLFASLNLAEADKDRTDFEAGFDSETNGFTVGADYAATADWFLGGAFGWTANDLDYKADGGGVDADIYTFIAFSTYHLNNFSFDVQLGYGSSDIEVSRHIAYGTLDDALNTRTRGATSGEQFFASTEVQYLWSLGALSFYPRAKLYYSGSHVDPYADNDAGGWEVQLSEQDVEQVDMQVGLQTTYALNFNWGVMQPYADLNLISNVTTSQDVVAGYFAFAPEDSLSFAVAPEEQDNLYYLLGGGCSFVFPYGWSAFFGVRATVGYDDYSATQYQAGLRKEI